MDFSRLLFFRIILSPPSSKVVYDVREREKIDGIHNSANVEIALYPVFSSSHLRRECASVCKKRLIHPQKVAEESLPAGIGTTPARRETRETRGWPISIESPFHFPTRPHLKHGQPQRGKICRIFFGQISAKANGPHAQKRSLDGWNAF